MHVYIYGVRVYNFSEEKKWQTWTEQLKGRQLRETIHQSHRRFSYSKQFPSEAEKGTKACIQDDRDKWNGSRRLATRRPWKERNVIGGR